MVFTAPVLVFRLRLAVVVFSRKAMLMGGDDAPHRASAIQTPKLPVYIIIWFHLNWGYRRIGSIAIVRRPSLIS